MCFGISIRIHVKLFLLVIFSVEFSKSQVFETVTIDKCGDAAPENWKFPTGWGMQCYDDINSLKAKVTADPYNDMISGNFNWSAFESAKGIWVFFNQDPPPELDVPSPAIEYQHLSSISKSIEITYFMYGNQSDRLVISTPCTKEVIFNQCGFHCDLTFVQSDRIQLDRGCGEEDVDCGATQFNIDLNTSPGQSFVFVDKIIVNKAKRQTQPALEASATSLSTRANNLTKTTIPVSPEQEQVNFDSLGYFTYDVIEIDKCADAHGTQWTFPKRWLMFCFDDVKSLRENATADTHNSMIPKNFDWSAFEKDTGIWAFFYQDPPPEFDLPLPTISYHGNSMCRSVEITYFMYGNQTDYLDISTSYISTNITNDCGFICNLKFEQSDQIQLDDNCDEQDDKCGTTRFDIDLNMTAGHSFILIDKIVINKDKTLTGPPKITTTTTSTTPIQKTTTARVEETSTCKNCNGSQASLGNSSVFIVLASVMMITVYYFQYI